MVYRYDSPSLIRSFSQAVCCSPLRPPPMFTTGFGGSRLALWLILSALSAFAQFSNVVCTPGWDWANNTLRQNPCLVAAYLQSVCSGTSYNVLPLPTGHHYIGPTGDPSTQNACSCSSVVYTLFSACGQCQRRETITYSAWTLFCASHPIPPGVYNETIPEGTAVPAWAFINPKRHNDTFNATIAKLVGGTLDKPERTPPMTTSISTLNTSTQRSSGTHIGPIAGGVVGGIIVLALLASFAIWLLKKHQQDTGTDGASGHAEDEKDRPPSLVLPSFPPPDGTKYQDVYHGSAVVESGMGQHSNDPYAVYRGISSISNRADHPFPPEFPSTPPTNAQSTVPLVPIPNAPQALIPDTPQVPQNPEPNESHRPAHDQRSDRVEPPRNPSYVRPLPRPGALKTNAGNQSGAQ
ncbi:uncharacterized protein EI90DRAFT_1354275 [Cantharellus anzutake]|uniref:uncharacterized protein n=1 Tax=Cantharellus anzutake TaxID=1750568 RepID=UPI0019088C7C|nr:uncharacterized protein EI90DRAFT_1354275 [Cantharellus anzutake]KAF8329850.1 hypothetical protein EI90DRAFT_1354275 [Cantharellus anzutake]